MYVETNRYNTYGCNEIKCPYCGAEKEDSWEVSGEDGDIVDLDCLTCDKSFSVTIIVSRTYTSNCLESEHEMVTNGEYKLIGKDQERYFRCKNCEYTGWHSDEEAEKFKSIEVVEEIAL